MENQNSSYSVQIGRTTFIVCVKQSETAKKPIEKMFKDIHNTDTEAKKSALFSKVRSGDVRILLGSTAKMGAGTNV